MKIYVPDYYDRFRCLAGACPDSCCQEWDVQVDPEAAEKYLALPGALGDALREKLVFSDGEYTLQITDGRCPMWRTDGLCRIQAELGEGGLCHVCRDFPRLTHDYGDFRELDLELSCPEAARLILSGEPVTMLCREVPGGEDPAYDPIDMEILRRTREEALKILNTHPLPEAFALLLLYGYEAQNLLDGGEPAEFVPEQELAFAKSIAVPGDASALVALYETLDILTPRWRQRLRNPAGSDKWQTELKAMAAAGIRRYWLQAISDFDLVSRVKSVLAGCLLVGHLGGNMVETIQLYSKEIDNSIENTEALRDAAYESSALTDTHLLGLIFQ